MKTRHHREALRGHATRDQRDGPDLSACRLDCRVTEAEHIAHRMLEGRQRDPRLPKPVTIRRLSWQTDD